MGDGQDLGELLDLEAVAPMRFCNRLGDANAQDRAYGGQILGQALLAAARTVPAGRPFATMQFLFLQGTLHAQPIDFAVEALQDRKRSSSRHVRGMQQGGRAVLDAQLSFAVPIDAPVHEVAPVPSASAVRSSGPSSRSTGRKRRGTSRGRPSSRAS